MAACFLLFFYLIDTIIVYPCSRTTAIFHYYHDIKTIAKENIRLLVNRENRLPEGNSLFQIMETILNFRKRTKFFRKYHWVQWNNDIAMWTLLTSRRRWWLEIATKHIGHLNMTKMLRYSKVLQMFCARCDCVNEKINRKKKKKTKREEKKKEIGKRLRICRGLNWCTL